MVAQEMVCEAIRHVAGHSSQFDSHEIINWIVEHYGAIYSEDLRARGGEPAPPRECQVGSPQVRREITKRASAARPLNNQISRWVKKCPGVTEISRVHVSPTIWGIPGKNYLWKRI
jgi:hypothetical protein